MEKMVSVSAYYKLSTIVAVIQMTIVSLMLWQVMQWNKEQLQQMKTSYFYSLHRHKSLHTLSVNVINKGLSSPKSSTAVSGRRETFSIGSDTRFFAVEEVAHSYKHF